MSDLFAPFAHLILARFEHWTLLLSEDQRYIGRCYAAANRPKAGDLPDATQSERDELFGEGGIVDLMAKVLGEIFHPDRYNWPILGNEWEHLHMHIIPRYKGDRIFLEETFTDGRWGQNYTPREKRRLEPRKLIALRNLLRDKIAEWHPDAVPSS